VVAGSLAEGIAFDREDEYVSEWLTETIDWMDDEGFVVADRGIYGDLADAVEILCRERDDPRSLGTPEDLLRDAVEDARTILHERWEHVLATAEADR